MKALIEKNTWSGIEEYYRHMGKTQSHSSATGTGFSWTSRGLQPPMLSCCRVLRSKQEVPLQRRRDHTPHSAPLLPLQRARSASWKLCCSLRFPW